MLAAKSTQPLPCSALGALQDAVRQYERCVKLLRLAIPSFFVLCFWIAGCATQADLQQLQSERAVVRTQAANTHASLDSLRREIQRVQGEVEELRHRLNRVSQQGRGTAPQLRKIEKRLTSLEGRMHYAGRSPEYRPGGPPLPRPKGVEAEGTPSLPFGPPASSPAAPTVPTALPADSKIQMTNDSPACQDLYRGALRLFRGQTYDPAIQEFRKFQRQCPDSKMADDAQYWIGESHYLQDDYNRAILEFNDVLSYRRGDRVPAALFRQAQAFLAIGDKTDARLILRKLVSDYPSATQTVEAQTMLQTLGR